MLLQKGNLWAFGIRAGDMTYNENVKKYCNINFNTIYHNIYWVWSTRDTCDIFYIGAKTNFSLTVITVLDKKKTFEQLYFYRD